MDILHMNEILKPFQERTYEVEEANIQNQCETMEDNLNYLNEESTTLKEMEEGVSKLIELTTNDIFKMFDDAYNEFNPDMMGKYKFLKTQIKDQKDENSNLSKQIDLLSQEVTTIEENIKKLCARLIGLQMHCGFEKKESVQGDDDESDEDEDDDDDH